MGSVLLTSGRASDALILDTPTALCQRLGDDPREITHSYTDLAKEHCCFCLGDLDKELSVLRMRSEKPHLCGGGHAAQELIALCKCHVFRLLLSFTLKADLQYKESCFWECHHAFDDCNLGIDTKSTMFNMIEPQNPIVTNMLQEVANASSPMSVR